MTRAEFNVYMSKKFDGIINRLCPARKEQENKEQDVKEQVNKEQDNTGNKKDNK